MTVAVTLAQTVLDTPDVRGLAEFYRQLLDLRYRPGDEPPADGAAEDVDWLVLHNPGGGQLAFQLVRDLPEAIWPDGPIPQQLHLDLTVPDIDALWAADAHARSLGARLLHDRSDDEEEPLRVYADPAGHPFCIFVG
jgi:Glyoxalase-like domain